MIAGLDDAVDLREARTALVDGFLGCARFALANHDRAGASFCLARADAVRDTPAEYLPDLLPTFGELLVACVRETETRGAA